MENHERLDVAVDGFCGGRNLADLIVLRKFRKCGPARLRTLTLHHHHLVRLLAHHALKRGHETEHGTLRPRDARDETRNVVLERGFGALAEVGESLFTVTANRHKAEVHGLPERSHVLRLDAVALGPFLGVGIRLRIVGLKDDVAVAGEFVFLEKALDLIGVGFDCHRGLGGGRAEVELERHILVKLAENGFGTLRERIEPFGGKVDAERHGGEDEVRGAEHGGEKHKTESPLLSAVLLSVGDGMGCGEHEHHHGHIVADVREVDHAAAERLEMRHERAGGDRIHNGGRHTPVRDSVHNGIKADEEHRKRDGERGDEADHLAARKRGREHADRGGGAGEQEAAEISAEHRAPVGGAEPCGRRYHGEREGETDSDERPGCEEFSDERLRKRDRKRQKKFNRAVAALLRPRTHRGGRHQKEIHPRMPEEERRKVGLAALVEHRNAEREESRENEKRHEEHIGDGRVEVALELTPENRLDVAAFALAHGLLTLPFHREIAEHDIKLAGSVHLAELLGRSVGLDFAVGDDDRTGADGIDLFENVGGDDDGLFGRHLLDHLTDNELLVRIETVGRLVHDKHLGVVDDRLREACALTVTLGERIDSLVGDIRETRLLKHGLDLSLRLRAVEPADLRDEFEERLDRHRAVGGSVLGEVADARLRGDWILEDVVPADHGRAGRWRNETGDHPHCCRFAGAVRAEEPKHFALPDREGYALHRLERTEVLFQIFNFQHFVFVLSKFRIISKQPHPRHTAKTARQDTFKALFSLVSINNVECNKSMLTEC